MSTIPLKHKCPKCGSNSIKLAVGAEAEGDTQLVCTACGRKGPALDFVDKADALDKAAKLLQESLRDIPGFKKK